MWRQTVNPALRPTRHREMLPVHFGAYLASDMIQRFHDLKLSAILSTPWTKDGSTFSDRLWTNKQKLIQETQNTLTQGIMTGKAPDKMIKEIQFEFCQIRTSKGLFRFVHGNTVVFGEPNIPR